MRLEKRIPAYSLTGGQTRSLPLVVGLCIGSTLFVLGALVLVCFVVQRRSKRHVGNKTPLKQFLLPKQVKPVISYKTAAGPGGLKKSPSPVQSPEQLDDEWAERSTLDCNTLGLDTSKVMQDSATSVTSVSISEMPEAECSSDKRGELNFNLRYSFEKNALMVNIMSATNLPSVSNKDLLDPYVKLQLLPEKQHKVKTRVVRNTLNPVYEEEFTFYGLNYNQLQSTTLHFAVVAFDRYSRDEIIGEVICPLHTVNLTDSDAQASMSMEMVSRSLKFQNSTQRGELLISLCHQPSTNKITVVVLKAKNLPKFDITGLADPYVKVYMLLNGQKLTKKKTHVKKRTLAPVYNETFTFDVPTNDVGILDQISFEFMIMDWDRVTKNEVMGRAVIGVGARSHTGKNHWDQVLHNPRRQIAEWHRLRP